MNSYIFNYNNSSGSILFEFFFHFFMSIFPFLWKFKFYWLMNSCWRSFYPNITTFTNDLNELLKQHQHHSIFDPKIRKKHLQILSTISLRHEIKRHTSYFFSFVYVYLIKRRHKKINSYLLIWNCKLFDICLELIISRTK